MIFNTNQQIIFGAKNWLTNKPCLSNFKKTEKYDKPLILGKSESLEMNQESIHPTNPFNPKLFRTNSLSEN